MSRLWSLAVLALLLSACRTLPVGPETPALSDVASRQLATLAELEDRRSGGQGRVSELALEAEEPRVRARAMRVIARLQHPSLLPTILEGLKDEGPGVRAEAAFAAWSLGLSWQPLEHGIRTQLTSALLAQEAMEKDAGVQGRLLRALGRMGTSDANVRLVERLSHAESKVRIAAGVALGVALKRGDPLPAGALERLGASIDPALPEGVRFGAAYALAFSRAAEAAPLLARVAKDPDPEIRLLAAKGLGGSPCASHALLGELLEDGDWRVAVEATRSLSTCADAESIRVLEKLLGKVDLLEQRSIAAGAQPLLTFAQARLAAPMLPLLDRLRLRIAAAAKKEGVALRELGKLDCRLAAARVSITGTPANSDSCGFGVVDADWRTTLILYGLAGAAHVQPGLVAERVRLLSSASASVRSAALELLVAHGSPGEKAYRLRELTRAREDLSLAASAAEALAKLEKVDAADRTADLLALRALLRELDQAPDLAESVMGALVAMEGAEAAPTLRAFLTFPHAHVRHTAATLLTELTKESVTAPLVPISDSEDHRLAQPPPEGTRLRVRTEKGDFVVALFTAEAPQTIANLVGLFGRGFYEGLTFHRVVPDFVVQGGDPGGSGEGGPGYTQRCEVSPRPYFTGTVGIALSGKDTGGSQFFVTHSPQPHLEGRYPIIGQVEQGQVVVDALLEGDRILGIDVLL